MHFSEIFKDSFLSGLSTFELTPSVIITVFLISSLFALYIFIVYKVITRKEFYDKSFNMSLAVIVIIVSAIVLTIQSSLVVSLGMVGALSIVRFRTAIKNSLDLAFMFWAVSVGIICGAGLPTIALIASLVITVGCFVLDAIPDAKTEKLLIINAEGSENKKEIESVLKKYTKYHKVKSESIIDTSFNMIIEVKVKKDIDLVREISSLAGIKKCSLIDHSGEITY